MINRLIVDDGFDQSFDHFVFISPGASFSEAELASLRQIKTLLKDAFLGEADIPQSGQPAIRVAVFVPDEVQGSIMNLFKSLWLLEDPSPLCIEHFTTLSDAITWLDRKGMDETDFAREVELCEGN